MKKGLNTFLAAVLALGTTGLAFANSTDLASQQITSSADTRLEQRLSGEVRHELNMIPQFTVFDNLAYRVDGGTVTLFGQVRDAIVKDSAEARVKHLEGVERVDNQIEILPASFNDDHIRRRVALSGFQRSPSVQLRNPVRAADSHHREERSCEPGRRGENPGGER